MIKRTISIAIIVAISIVLECTQLFAVQPGIGCNGEGWKMLKDADEAIDGGLSLNAPDEAVDDSVCRTAIIRGVYEGIWAYTINEEINGVSELPCNIGYEDIVNAVDAFYSDYRNCKIPVYYALRVIKMEISWVKRNNIDTYLEELRDKFKDSVIKWQH